MSARAGLLIVQPYCRECGCTQDNACLDEVTGLGCAWVNDEQTVCSVCAVEFGERMLAIAAFMRAAEREPDWEVLA